MTRKPTSRQGGTTTAQDTTLARAAIALIAVGMILGTLISV